uniref:Caspase-3-like n=1 Tax=Dermatophagoides pteronyssinus TaxID=6956 RepID=A0A6P6Y286_DERPT|nr:caspase-3-like [Dermatophagoides pteronyssinus]
MDERKARYILTNLDELADNLKLTEEFWQRFEREKIFPTTYIEHMKNNKELDTKILKKNLLIDITKRSSPSSYEKLSKIFKDLFSNNRLDDWYKSHYSNQRPGYCLIINNQNFEKSDNRIGSEKDVRKLSEIFECLNFHVVERSNLTRSQMLTLMSDLNDDKTLNDYDIFLLIIMSHGDSKQIITVDEKRLNYDKIEYNFSHEKCPQLKNKPKIIIFNCCRKTTTTSNDDDDDDEDLKERNFERQESIDGGGGTIKDMIVVYSTLKYYLSVRDEEQGTFFVDCLVKSLQEYKESNLDKIIEKATDLLNEKVTDISNQIERRQAIEISKRGVDKAVYFRISPKEKI